MKRLRNLLRVWGERWRRTRLGYVDIPPVVIIPFNQAVLCLSCRVVSDWHGEVCPACAQRGTLVSLARILQPTPELGRICYVLTSVGNA